MTPEVWLKPNRRIYLLGGILVFAFALAMFAVGVAVEFSPLRIGFLTAGAVLTLFAIFWARQAWAARLVYADDHLQVRLGGPTRSIPIDLVECFFLGQGPAGIGPEESEASSIVVRLAERAEDWKKVEINRRLGLWCDGYITIRGAWCEPISPTLMERLNKRLAEVHRERKVSA